MSNIIKAFINIVNNPIVELTDYYEGRNRINNAGKALEVYIQDAFAGTINELDENVRLRKFTEIYSYQGNQNNPPDLMLKNSDAIEVKKLQSKNSAIALNSSYPKAKLYADSPMLTKACKECEDWDEKDIIYTIGYTSDTKLNSLWMVYGDCFCASKEIYERIKDTITNGINSIPDVEFTETKELGKVKKVDPLGITDLRIRGMWHIDNPNKVFDYLYKYDESKSFQLICLLSKAKYDGLPLEDREALESLGVDGVEVLDVGVKNPDNPVKLVDAKMLVFKV
ncbi:MAG: restriction endonuclease [Sulfurovum sp.]|nr:MAG: restriction endonuclease [Sulfurovum sp.]